MQHQVRQYLVVLLCFALATGFFAPAASTAPASAASGERVLIVISDGMRHDLMKQFAAAPAAWLAACQEADGAWQPARHGGDPAYRPALTALAALALARDPADRFREGVRRATDALVALQTADGAFGGEGRVRAYNQAIAAYALATLAPHGPATAAALERAVAFSRAGQSAEGGWDYEAGSEGNTAVTAWQVRALAAAAERGVGQANIPLRKGLRWLRGAARSPGSGVPSSVDGRSWVTPWAAQRTWPRSWKSSSVGRNSRTERRPAMAASTDTVPSRVGSGSGISPPCE